jgi:hypothetical protein
MRQKRTLLSALALVISVLLVAGCSKTVYVTTTDAPKSVPTTTTTIKPKPITVAPIDFGSDCNSATLEEILRLVEEIETTRVKFDEDRDKSDELFWDAGKASLEAWRELRSYVRTLDIPLLDTQQRNYVDAMQDFISALNRYLESDGTDMGINDELLSLDDAETDFFDAVWESCDR